MQIEVAMTLPQYLEANRLLNMHTTRSRRLNFLAVWYGYPVMGAVFALLTVTLLLATKTFSSSVGFSVTATAFFLWCRMQAPSKFRKAFSQQQSNFQGTMVLSESGMHFERTNGTANTDYKWTAFESWMDRPEMFLLLPNPLSFIVIPKDKLSASEQDEVRTWIASEVKRIA